MVKCPGLKCVLLLLLLVAQGADLPVQAQDADMIIIRAVEWNHAGTHIAAVGIRPDVVRGYIFVIDDLSGETVYQSEVISGGFTSVAWSPDDRFIAAGSYDNSVWVIDVTTGTQTARLYGHQATVSDVDWSPDGTTLASAGNWDELIISWNTATYQELRRITIANFGQRIQYSPDGERLAVGQQGILTLFPSALSVGDLSDQAGYIVMQRTAYSLAWSHTGTYIALGSRGGPNVGSREGNVVARITIFNTETQSIASDLESPWGTVVGLAWSPDDTLLAAYNENGTVALWRIASGQVETWFEGSSASRYLMNTPDFSRYGGRLAYGVAFDPAQPSAAKSPLAALGIAIVVPDPSVERLRAIAGLCAAPLALTEGLPDTLDTDGIDAFTARVESLPDGAIPPACTADLLAVAEAIREQSR